MKNIICLSLIIVLTFSSALYVYAENGSDINGCISSSDVSNSVTVVPPENDYDLLDGYYTPSMVDELKTARYIVSGEEYSDTIYYSFYSSSIYAPCGESIDCYMAIRDFVPQCITYLDDLIFSSWGANNTKISESSGMYNCHSYAWYSQEYESNSYWISDPSEYYVNNTSYYDGFSSLSEVEVGDLVCYYEYGINMHSAIVVDIKSETPTINDIVVQSKWGIGPLIQHDLTNSPYYTLGSTSFVFYARNDHDHIFDYVSESDNADWCKFACEMCNLTIWKEHTWIYRNINDYNVHSADCINCSAEKNTGHSWKSIGAMYRCELCGYRTSYVPILPTKNKKEDEFTQ